MQEVAVFVIVALAALYAAWKVMPGAWRARLAQPVLGWARRRGWLSDPAAAVLARRLNAGLCGSCDDCGGCGSKPAATPDAAPPLRFVPGKSGAERP